MAAHRYGAKNNKKTWIVALTGAVAGLIGLAGLPPSAGAQNREALEDLRSLDPSAVRERLRDTKETGEAVQSRSRDLRRLGRDGDRRRGDRPKPGPDEAGDQDQDKPKDVSGIEKLYTERLGTELEQFGYETLTSRDEVLAHQVGAPQDNYILGAGDEVIITLRGQDNALYRVRVDRDGRVVIPKLEPLAAGGRTLGAFRESVEAAVAASYIATQAFVSVGEIREVSVLVAGEAVNPGTQRLTGLSTVLDAILLAGGVAKTGSLRNIRILRNGDEIPVDLYTVLAGTHGRGNPVLTDGDKILVPPLGPTVAVSGDVRRPAIYELQRKKPMSVREAVKLAGGTAIRGAYKYTLARTHADGTRTFLDVSADLNQTVGDGDMVFVQTANDLAVGQISLRGHTPLAGEYALAQAQTISDLLPEPSKFKAAPYLLFGIVSRRHPGSFSRELMAFSPFRILEGQIRAPLREGDILYVFGRDTMRFVAAEALKFTKEQSKRQFTSFIEERRRVQSVTNDEDVLSSQLSLELVQRPDFSVERALDAPRLRLSPSGVDESTKDRTMRRGMRREDGLPLEFDAEALAEQGIDTAEKIAEMLDVDARTLFAFLTEYTARIRGAVRVPGHYLVADETPLDQLIRAAGGLKRTADLASVEITATEIDNTTGQSSTRRRNIDVRQTALREVKIQPMDAIVLREVFTDRRNGQVSILGEVRFPGAYNIVRGERLSSLIARAGGYTDQAYPYGVIFTRRSVATMEKQSNLRKARELERAVVLQSSRRDMNLDQLAFLQELVRALREEPTIGRVTVEADPNILLAKPELDMELEVGDAIHVPARPSSVTVWGQVLNPGSYQFIPDKSPSDYIELAGGYGRLSDRKRTFVIHPDGRTERLKDSIWHLSRTKVVPGAVIVVPQDINPFFLRDAVRDVTDVVSNLAITGASLSSLSN